MRFSDAWDSIKLSVIIVTYNADRFLPGCLNSLAKEVEGISHEVFVVDNSPGDSVANLIRDNFTGIKFIKNGRNLGFAAANNIAISRSSGRYILLLNPDTLVEANSVKFLIGYLERNPGVGLAAGRLKYGDGSLQHSIRNFPTLLNQLGECMLIYKLPFAGRLFSEMVRDSRKYRDERSIEWVIGAQLLLKRQVVDQIGLLDERFFLYSEEQDWCYRIKGAGWDLRYLPDAEFVHYEGESSINPKLYSQLLISSP